MGLMGFSCPCRGRDGETGYGDSDDYSDDYVSDDSGGGGCFMELSQSGAVPALPEDNCWSGTLPGIAAYQIAAAAAAAAAAGEGQSEEGEEGEEGESGEKA
jgi:hypothetical protein